MRVIRVLLIGFLCIFFSLTTSFANEISDQFNLKFQKIDVKEANNELPKRVFRKLTPYKVSFKNISDSPFELHFSDVRLILEQDNQFYPLTEKVVYKKSKAHPIVRSVLVGVPVTLVSGGLFTVPVVGTTFSLGIDTNNTLKKSLDGIYFEKKLLQAGEVFDFYVFVSDKTSEVKDILVR